METKKEIIGTRVLANNGQAVIITGDGKCKRVVTAPPVSDEEIIELSRKATGTNNKVLFEKVKAVCEDAKLRKGWISAKGFRFRFAPAGFEMFDVENRMTPINLGETPTVDEIAKFIDKPRLATILENRKVVKPKVEAVEEPKAEVVVKTETDERKEGLRILRSASRKDFRYLTEIKGKLHDAVTNRKYRVQLGKMFKDILTKSSATQKRNYDKTLTLLREHLSGFDFAPTKKSAPKFMGLEELTVVSAAEFPTEVAYKNSEKGKLITISKTKFLAHDVLYNWPEYNVVIGKVATGELSLEDALAGDLELRDKYYEFKKECIAKNNDAVNILIQAIYDDIQEVSPLEFIYGSKLKVGEDIKVRFPDHRTSYKGRVTQVSPLKVRYEDGEVLHVLRHQNITY